ncbi:MAG: nitroreductase family protein [Patescibacteria group bacterium]|nr:nitroreductase family protein [Patescibacteria group bacterium]
MILKEIANRRSVREFKDEPVSEEAIADIIRAGQFAPTAMSSHAVNFIVIQKQEIKEAIFKIIGQEFIRRAPVLIIPAIDTGKSILPVQDLSVATENMFLQATALGLGSVWKNLTDQWAKKVKTLLNIPNNFLIINILPFGRPAKPPVPHGDADFDIRKIHYENW